jgi:hypothetical protein
MKLNCGKLRGNSGKFHRNIFAFVTFYNSINITTHYSPSSDPERLQELGVRCNQIPPVDEQDGELCKTCATHPELYPEK